MKTTLLILLTVLSLNTYSQSEISDTSKYLYYVDDSLINESELILIFSDSLFAIPNYKKDTIKVLLLVCDTSRQFYIEESYKKDSIIDDEYYYGEMMVEINGIKYFSSIFNYKLVQDTIYRESDYNIYWQYGYEVLENISESIFDPYHCYGMNYDSYWVHRKYLDINKNEFSKNIIIWQSYSIK